MALLPMTMAALTIKPNIIYVLVDDMGYGDLSCFGQKTLKTPNLDAMASGGLLFTQHIDQHVKEILAKLKETGLDENTLVIFTSDNGPHQEGGHKSDYFDSNGELRGKKRDLYEGGVRVPTIAHWPGVIKAGRRSDHVSGFQDIMPTFAELVGVESPKTDGISLVPTLLGNGEQPKHDHLFWEFYEGGGKKAVLRGKWKGIRLNTFKKPDGPIELYDIAKDISEQTNLASEHPDVVADMARIMEQEHVDRKNDSNR